MRKFLMIGAAAAALFAAQAAFAETPVGSAYFAARRVGDIAMRVRQLETIREFLTNASLSVFVDPPVTSIKW